MPRVRSIGSLLCRSTGMHNSSQSLLLSISVPSSIAGLILWSSQALKHRGIQETEGTRGLFTLAAKLSWLLFPAIRCISICYGSSKMQIGVESGQDSGTGPGSCETLPKSLHPLYAGFSLCKTGKNNTDLSHTAFRAGSRHQNHPVSSRAP